MVATHHTTRCVMCMCIDYAVYSLSLSPFLHCGVLFARSQAAWCVPCGMRNGCKYEQRRRMSSDEEGTQQEFAEQFHFCWEHREQSEDCIRPNTKRGIRKKKSKMTIDRVTLACPLCRNARVVTVQLNHPLLGLKRNYALSKRTNRL